MVWDQLFMDSFSIYSMWNWKNCQWQEQTWGQTPAHSTTWNRWLFAHMIKTVYLAWLKDDKGFLGIKAFIKICILLDWIKHLKNKA